MSGKLKLSHRWRQCSFPVCKLQKVGSHRCSRCFAVVYCDVNCQRLDWEVGGHKDRCQNAFETDRAFIKRILRDRARDLIPLFLFPGMDGVILWENMERAFRPGVVLEADKGRLIAMYPTLEDFLMDPATRETLADLLPEVFNEGKFMFTSNLKYVDCF
jgi:hypothetical protein